MKIEYIDKLQELKDKTAIALGNFDGCHLGHLKIFKNTLEVSKKMGLKSSVLLFTDHTRVSLDRPDFKVLSRFEEKIKILESLAFDMVFAVKLDKKFMSMYRDEFLIDLLKKKLNASAIIVGSDYRFAFKKTGDVEYLREKQNELSFDLLVTEDVLDNGHKISSSQIRDDLRKGKVCEVNKLIYGNYTVSGKVTQGFKRGRKLGFPTANLSYDTKKLIPLEGVYYTFVTIDNIKYYSMTSVGKNLTFGLEDTRIEVNILDFDKDIYGKDVELEFIKFLRPMIKFENQEQLISQMEKDRNLVKSLKSVYKIC